MLDYKVGRKLSGLLGDSDYPVADYRGTTVLQVLPWGLRLTVPRK